jgi:hypothetical protein
MISLGLSVLLVAVWTPHTLAGDGLLVADSGSNSVLRCVELNNDGDLHHAFEVIVFHDAMSGSIASSNETSAAPPTSTFSTA